MMGAVDSSKHLLDLVEQLKFIDQNPHGLVYKSREERDRKTLDKLVNFVDVVLKSLETREADVGAMLDSLVDTHQFTITGNAMKLAKEHWEERAKTLREQNQTNLPSNTEANLEEGALVTNANVYHCSLLCQAAYLETQQDVVSFLNGQRNHSLEEIALTDPSISPSYLIATSGDIVYVAFRQSVADYLPIWLPAPVAPSRSLVIDDKDDAGTSNLKNMEEILHMMAVFGHRRGQLLEGILSFD